MDFKELNKQIIEEFEKNNYVNKKINYQEFLNLYEPYKLYISEKTFADILGIGKAQFQEIKRSPNSNAIILKRINVSVKRKDEITEELREREYANIEVNYTEFKSLFELYKNEMIESKFAEILGISSHVLGKMKNEENKRVLVLKTNNVEQDLKEEIIKKLTDEGYTNKSINYQEFLQIYEPYKLDITEKQFATILGIRDLAYMKRSIVKFKILKTKKVDEQQKEEIVTKLKEQGYTNKLITYQEFLKLFENYSHLMSETDFAQILGITSYSYSHLKRNKSKSRILKIGKVSSEIKEEIQNELKNKGYENAKITYQEFLDLYEKYKYHITETDFAIVLNISEAAYRGLKYSGHKAKILKPKNITEERIKEIEDSLLEMGYGNQLINYEKFLELYSSYKSEMTENEFANILKIRLYGLKELKKQPNNRVKILESDEVIGSVKEQIVYDLKSQGYINTMVDYKEFLELYKPYKNNMSEEQFALILGMAFNSFINIKKTLNNKAIILKTDKVTEETVSEIREKFKSKTNTYINYDEFLELYEPYKLDMTELEFAEVLNISYGNFQRIRRLGPKTKILSTDAVTQERKQEIYDKIKSIIDVGEEIDYNEFLRLFESYKEEMTKRDFAEILEIPVNRYNQMIYYGKRIRIYEITSEEIEKKIISDIKQRNYDKKMITYEEFLILYEEYKYTLSQNRFRQILGISSLNGDTRRYRINLKKQQLENVKYIIGLESREYSKSELEKICDENDITLYELLEDLKNIYLNQKHEIIEKLLKKEKIYIGKCPIPREFQEKNATILLEKAIRLSRMYGKLYRRYVDYEDMASEALMYTLENKGELVINADNEEEAIDAIGGYLHCMIKYNYMKLRGVRGTISLDDNVSKKIDRPRYEVIRDKKDYMNPQSSVERVDFNAKNNIELIQEMKVLYESGMNNTEAINFIIKKYNISREELLKILEIELSKKRKIKQSNGKVYLGEEYEIN